MHCCATTLMAVLLAVHAAVGCCWHHAHARKTAATGSACCEHHHDEQEEQQQPGRRDVECEGTCQYVGSERVRVDDANSAGWTEFVGLAATFADRQALGAARIGES